MNNKLGQSVTRADKGENVLVHSEQWRQEGLVRLASNKNELNRHILYLRNHTKSCNDIIFYPTGRSTEILLKYLQGKIGLF